MIKRHPVRASLLSVLLLSLVLGACLVSHQLPDGPIPQARYAAPSGATEGPLVIVLPGIQDDMDSLQGSGMVDQIQRANPDATVILAAASPRGPRDSPISGWPALRWADLAPCCTKRNTRAF